MSGQAPRPMCFVAMPFGRKPPPGRSEPVVDFDSIYEHVSRAVEAERLECIRADFEPGGGFIHRSMYESLLVAEYVVADLTFSNPNVTYEVGVRHGASARPTILIGAEGLVGELPFDFRPLRVFAYRVSTDGTLAAADAAGLEAGLRERLRSAIEGGIPIDNPIMQVTTWSPAGRLEHDKTDVFLKRLEFASQVGERVSRALASTDAGAAVAALAALEQELLDGPEVVAELHSALLGIYLGYRERKAYQRMVDLQAKLPGELLSTPVVREQCALALNRLAEKAEEAGAEGIDPEQAAVHRARAAERRTAALKALDGMPAALVTSETWGIRGRIYKGWYDAECTAGNEARAAAMLSRAIETYERGFRADLRDYYPGINVVTLRLRRGTADDHAALESLVPVVRLAVDCAPEAQSEEERYWQTATKLELATAALDWEAVRLHLTTLLGLQVASWMRQTTADNLGIQRGSFEKRREGAAVREIDRIVAALVK